MRAAERRTSGPYLRKPRAICLYLSRRHDHAVQMDTRESAVEIVPQMRQWVIVALVKALDVVAIEALVTDLHPGTQRAHGRKFLDGEPDRLRCGRKAAIAQRLSCPALALAHEQLGGYAVVECHSLAVGRFCVHVEFYHGNRPERIVWTPSERAPISGGRPCRPGPRSRHRAERDSARRARSRSQGLRIG